MCTVTNTPLRVNRVNDCLKAISLPEVPSELEMPHHKIRKENCGTTISCVAETLCFNRHV